MRGLNVLLIALVLSPIFTSVYSTSASEQASPVVSTRFLPMNSDDIYLYHDISYDYFVFKLTLEIWNRKGTFATFYFPDTCKYSPIIRGNPENKSILTFGGTSCGNAITKVDFASGVHKENWITLLFCENWTRDYLPNGKYNITTLTPIYSGNRGSPANDDYHNFQTIVTVVNGTYNFSYDPIPVDWGKTAANPIYRSILIFSIMIGSLIIVLLIRKLYYRIKNYQNLN